MKILLPVYAKEDGKLIIDFVANFCWMPGVKVLIVHVLGSTADGSEELTARQSGEELIAWFGERLAALLPKAELSADILNGSPVLEILQKASDWQANMIVMGHRTRDVKTMLAGSVSNGVVTQSPCSVVVIRPPVEAAASGAHHLVEFSVVPD